MADTPAILMRGAELSHNSNDSTTTTVSASETNRWLFAWWALIAVWGLLFCLQVGFTAKPVFESDEAAHMSYAIAIAHGELPTINTVMSEVSNGEYPFITNYAARVDGAHQGIWVANHPPLYYTVSAPLVWISEWAGEPALLPAGMRILNALFVAGAIFATGLLARELFPRRLLVQALAPVGMILFRNDFFQGGLIFNDGLALLLTTLLFTVMARAIRSGLPTKLIWVMAGLGSLASLTRVTGVLAVFVCALAVFVAGLLRDQGSGRIKRAVVKTAIAGGIPAIVAGWFYVRNILLYGDPTASAALLERFEREPKPQFWEPSGMVKLITMAWERFLLPSTRVKPGFSDWYTISHAIVGITLLCIVGGVIRWVYLHSQAMSRPRLDARLLVVIAALGLACLLTVYSLIDFVTQGGGLHPRYLGGVSPVIAVALAGAIASPIGHGQSNSRWTIADSAMLTVATVMVVAYAMLTQRWLIDWMSTDGHQLDTEPARITWILICVTAVMIIAATAVCSHVWARALPDRQPWVNASHDSPIEQKRP